MKQLVFRLVCSAILAAMAFGATSLGQSARLAIAVAVGLPSFILLMISRRQLGNSFSITAKAKVLVTTGLYSRIRHPMYLFVDLFLLALIIAFDWPILLFVWGILVVMQTMQGRREDKVLASAFGPDYDTYRDRTWF